MPLVTGQLIYNPVRPLLRGDGRTLILDLPKDDLASLAYEGKELTVEYGDLERHWEFWSLNVTSPQLVTIRKELGLRTDFRLHITVGRQLDWQPRVKQSGVLHDTDYIKA